MASCSVLEQILQELCLNHVIEVDSSDFLLVSGSAATQIISITCLVGVWILHLSM